MTGERRPRGRPCGTGKDDRADLNRVADLLLKEPPLTRAGAMRRVMKTRPRPETEQTLLRRWHGKWQREGATIMEAARNRARHQTETIESIGQSLYDLGAHVGMMLDAVARSPALRDLDAMMKSGSRVLQDLESRFKAVDSLPPELTRFLNYKVPPELANWLDHRPPPEMAAMLTSHKVSPEVAKWADFKVSPEAAKWANFKVSPELARALAKGLGRP